MYNKFKLERVALSAISLDVQNPRIISQQPLASEDEIVKYFFEHEELAAFLKMIASEGRNPGAERPYVIKAAKGFAVVEGNTRIAAYKLLTGQMAPPEAYQNLVPHLPQNIKDELVSVDVAIAPSRESLMIIMARSHFGRGDKNRWRYLGSRKAVHDDWKAGKSISFLANVFGRTQSQIRDYIVEYLLYLEALSLDWTSAEKEILLRPSLEFNPPVRFFQTTGHKQYVGIELDKTNLKINFIDKEAIKKFKHVIKKMVLEENGPGATAAAEEVFKDYQPQSDTSKKQAEDKPSSDEKSKTQPKDAASDDKKHDTPSLKPFALFNYSVTRNDLTLIQLMKEAKDIHAKKFPGCGTGLLRSIVEVLLKLIIDDKNLNPQGKLLDVESAANLVIGQGKLGADDTGILKEFKNSHIKYINLSSHATVVPNYDRLIMARDCVDAFVKRNV